MKELLRDRVDVLMEKAHAGDGDAQLKLAKWFYEGHLVEKSIDQAKYWAFKAILARNASASSFYANIVNS